MTKYEKSKVVKYAMSNLANTIGGNDISFTTQNEEIFIILKSGHTLRLSDDEIKHQASEYLRSEIESINTIY
jgi:hypothetical protein